MSHEPVEHGTTDRPLGRLSSGREVSVTVHRYVGGSGPTVYLQAAQHGIELNGPATLRRLHADLVDAELAGTVVAVPVANPLAFDHRSYMTPSEYDVMNPNLNRVWPGDAEGSLQERMAARLWGLVADADAVVDLHTGTADMLEHVRFHERDGDARALAAAFGTEHLLVDRDEALDDPEGDEAFRGKLRAAAARADIPALTAELANSRTVARPAVETGLAGVRNVLRELDVLAEPSREPPAQSVFRDADADARADASGLFEPAPDVTVGDRVRAGDTLGTVYCPSTFERLQTVTADTTGLAYSLTREAVVVAGERVAAIAEPT